MMLSWLLQAHFSGFVGRFMACNVNMSPDRAFIGDRCLFAGT